MWHHGNRLRQRRGVNLRWWQITFPFLIFENRNRLINFKINICGKCSFTDWTRCSCGGCWCLAKSAVGGGTPSQSSDVLQWLFPASIRHVSYVHLRRSALLEREKGSTLEMMGERVVASCYSTKDQRQRVILWPDDLCEMFWGYIVLCYSALYLNILASIAHIGGLAMLLHKMPNKCEANF